MTLDHRMDRLVLVLVAAAGIASWPVAPAFGLTLAVQQSVHAGPQSAAPADDRVLRPADVIRTRAAASAPEMTLTIQTAPPIAGVRLSLDGNLIVTDRSGLATVTQERNSQNHTLILLDAELQTTDKKYTFNRWFGQRDPDQAYIPTLNGLTMRADAALTAAFTIQDAINPHFVDQNGQAIDPSLVSSASARSDTGVLVNVAPTGMTWLSGSRVISRMNVVEIQSTSYSWQTVTVAGTNVVDAGQQTFTPATTPEVTVVGQFHDLTITGYDALLGHGVGEQAVVTFPDGTKQTAVMDSDHTAVFPRLPRGTYQASVKAGTAIIGDHQLRLSRDVTLNVPVISPVDLTIMAGSLILVAVGLVLVGHRHIRRRLIAPFQHSALKEVKAG